MGGTYRNLTFLIDPDSVEDYKFHSFDGVKSDPQKSQDFEFHELDKSLDARRKDKDDLFLKDEREKSVEGDFVISPIVKQYRGIKDQEKREREELIELEVAKRLRRLKDQAIEEGFNEGVERGRTEAYSKLENEINTKIDTFSVMIDEVLKTHAEIVKNQKDEIYTLVRNLTKWVILRELDGDNNYLERLLERLTTELGTSSNILIQVNENEFDQMKDVLDVLQKRVTKMKNVRVEVDYEVPEKGIVVESQTGVVRGTLVEQFASLDKLFESVGVKADPNEGQEILNFESLKEQEEQAAAEPLQHEPQAEIPQEDPAQESEDDKPESSEDPDESSD